MTGITVDFILHTCSILICKSLYFEFFPIILLLLFSKVFLLSESATNIMKVQACRLESDLYKKILLAVSHCLGSNEHQESFIKQAVFS